MPDDSHRLAEQATGGSSAIKTEVRVRLYCLPALKTNYFWLLQPDEQVPEAYIFDPGDAAPVRDALQKHRLTLSGIVVTHHHWDHTDGIDSLLSAHPVPVYGPKSERIPQVTHTLSEGDTLTLGRLEFQVLATPGHTLDHIAFLLPRRGEQPASLFSADNIFGAGCGRMFEGEPEVFLKTLKRLASLEAETRIYCSHEYTLANIAFALAVEPENAALQRRRDSEQARRDQSEPTVPLTLALELATNPFLRTDQPAVAAAAETHAGATLATEAEVFAEIRRWKDHF